jgi:DNA/RNA endonuclease YhcR with UshA esterase domain
MSGGTEVQIRTSGFSRFSDERINDAVLTGEKTIDVTGILSNYQGSAQFTVIDIDGIKVN